MKREIIIFIYLIIFRVIFVLFRLFPLKKRVVIVASFEENVEPLLCELQNTAHKFDTILIHFFNLEDDFISKMVAKSIRVGTGSIFNQLRFIYYIATSKTIVIDNYYAFLSVTEFKEDVECIQIWHAAGAIKAFGLLDKSVENRYQSAKKRFLKVYKRFDKLVIGSELMGSIFKRTFYASEFSFLRTGIPRTDIFFDEEKKKHAVKKIYEKYPQLSDKKIILYSPTYRDNELDDFQFKLELKYFNKLFKNNYFLVIRLHPAVKSEIDLSLYSDYVLNLSKYKRINDLLLITDILITDYSSIPVEFSLLNKPMIFYPYDLNEYKKDRGIIGKYEEQVPGPIAFNTDDILNIILKNEFDYEMILGYSKEWNAHSKGNSSKRLVDYLLTRTQSNTEASIDET